MFIRNLPLSPGGGSASQFVATSDGTASAPAYTFTSDTDTGMYRVGAGQLGFSTDGTLRLTVNGSTSITSTLPYYAPDGTASAPAFTFTSDTNTGVYNVGADQLGLATGGTLRLTVNSSTSITSTLPWYGPNGSNTIPAVTFSGDTNTGMYNVGADQLGFATGGTLRLTVNGSTSITSTLPYYAPDGTVSAPGHAFTNEPDCGYYVIGTNNLGFALNGAKVVDWAPSAISFTQATQTSGQFTAFTLNTAALSGLTASTELHMVDWNIATTLTFATGALATERCFRIRQPTLAFAGASTVTNAYTVYIDGNPTAGTNATITNAWALGVGGQTSFLSNVLLATNQIMCFNSLSTGPAMFESANVYELSAGPTAGQTMRLRGKQSAGTAAADVVVASQTTRTSGDIIFQVFNASTTNVFRVEAPNTTDNNSNLWFTWRKSGANSTERILVGASDTAGPGYKALCVPN